MFPHFQKYKERPKRSLYAKDTTALRKTDSKILLFFNRVNKNVPLRHLRFADGISESIFGTRI